VRRRGAGCAGWQQARATAAAARARVGRLQLRAFGPARPCRPGRPVSAAARIAAARVSLWRQRVASGSGYRVGGRLPGAVAPRRLPAMCTSRQASLSSRAACMCTTSSPSRRPSSTPATSSISCPLALSTRVRPRAIGLAPTLAPLARGCCVTPGTAAGGPALPAGLTPRRRAQQTLPARLTPPRRAQQTLPAGSSPRGSAQA